MILLILTGFVIGVDAQRKFKSGDWWEYEYTKNTFSYYGPTPYDQASDTLSGIITVGIDSVVKHPDSTL